MAESFKHYQAALTTSNVVIYTAPTIPSTTSVIFTAQVANKDTFDSTTVTLAVSDASAGTNRFIAANLVVPAQSAVNVIGGKVVLEPGDSLNAYAGANGYYDLILSVLEIT